MRRLLRLTRRESVANLKIGAGTELDDTELHRFVFAAQSVGCSLDGRGTWRHGSGKGGCLVKGLLTRCNSSPQKIPYSLGQMKHIYHFVPEMSFAVHLREEVVGMAWHKHSHSVSFMFQIVSVVWASMAQLDTLDTGKLVHHCLACSV